MAAAFDPTMPAPNFAFQTQQLMRLYNQGLIGLNAKKGNTMAQYGFLNTPDYNTSGNVGDFSNIQVDPNQQHGLYRDELTTEANMLDSAENGPDRGFSGGVSNQASRAAQQAVAGRQNTFQQNLQQTLGGFNQEAGNDLFNYSQGNREVSNNAADYAGQEAAWRALNATSAPTTASVPGASGGGTTSIRPITVISPLNDTGGAKAAAAARSAGTAPTTKYNVFAGLGHNT